MSVFSDLLWLLPTWKSWITTGVAACALTVMSNKTLGDRLAEQADAKRIVARQATEAARLDAIQRAAQRSVQKGPLFPTALGRRPDAIDMTIVGTINVKPAGQD